jgi:hypothetical protein
MSPIPSRKAKFCGRNQITAGMCEISQNVLEDLSDRAFNSHPLWMWSNKPYGQLTTQILYIPLAKII